MHRLLLTAALATGSATISNAAPAPSIPPAVRQDLQCFVLYTVATGSEKDEKKLTGVIAGTWYFLGRIDAANPDIDLESAMRAELTDIQSNPKAKEIGAACDTQFSKRGTDLVNMGKKFAP